MIFRKSKHVYLFTIGLALVPIALLVISPDESESCGPYFTQTLFTYVVHPDLPLEKYAQGDLGILKPSYARSYLAVAYRHLMDKPLAQHEQQAAIRLWNKRLFERDVSTYVTIDSSIPHWDSLAHTVLPLTPHWLQEQNDSSTPQPDVSSAERIVYTSSWKPLSLEEYQSYYAITPDAFQNASRRLQELIHQYGKNSQEAKDWVVNQRRAFAGDDSTVPQEMEDATTVIGANRQYQVATAYFYRDRYDEARIRFEKIAQNPSSPWQQFGLYLASRALTRKATIGGDSSAFQEALTILDRIDDPKLARAILFQKDYLLGRIDPTTQILDLSKRMKDGDDRYYEHELDDYTKLLDRILGEMEYYFSEQRLFGRLPAQLRADDMTDWIYTFQSTDSMSLDHAIAQYKAKRTKPWLIAVLSKLPGYTADYFSTPVDVNDPAYESVTYYRAHILSNSGMKGQAKQLLDEALASRVSASARNDLMILRQKFATDMRDLVTMLARVPVGETEAFDFREWPDSLLSVPEPKYDTAALRVLNRTLSLDRLMEAVRLDLLSPTPQRDLMRAVWARAVVLGRQDHAKEIAARLATTDTVLSSSMRKYLAATTPADRHREAIFILLKHPGLSPLVWLAPGRSDIEETDSYRANGWCLIYADTIGISTVDLNYRGVILESAEIPFLTSTDRLQADVEWRLLTSSSPAVNYLANEAVKWGKAAPKDPRIAEVLHLAVKASRYGCNDDQTGKYSKAAFTLLHSKYGKTSWASKTQYWFGED